MRYLWWTILAVGAVIWAVTNFRGYGPAETPNVGDCIVLTHEVGVFADYQEADCSSPEATDRIVGIVRNPDDCPLSSDSYSEPQDTPGVYYCLVGP